MKHNQVTRLNNRSISLFILVEFLLLIFGVFLYQYFQHNDANLCFYRLALTIVIIYPISKFILFLFKTHWIKDYKSFEYPKMKIYGSSK